MSQVNLLPWRREVLHRRWRIYCLAAVMYMLCIFITLYILYVHQSREYAGYQTRRQQIETEHSQQLVELKQRQYLQQKVAQQTAWLKGIDRLRAKNHWVVSFFSQVEDVLPALVWLNEVSLHQRQLHLAGNGLDYQQIVAFSQKISELEFLQKAVLSRVNRNVSAAEEMTTFGFLYKADWPEIQP